MKTYKTIAESNNFIVLDNFDTLTNSLSEGLPKEIELKKTIRVL